MPKLHAKHMWTSLKCFVCQISVEEKYFMVCVNFCYVALKHLELLVYIRKKQQCESIPDDMIAN